MACLGRVPAPGDQVSLHGRTLRVEAVDGRLEGLTDLAEFQERTGLLVDPALHHLAKTLGGLVMACLGRVPAPGDQVRLHGRTLRVVALDGRLEGLTDLAEFQA